MKDFAIGCTYNFSQPFEKITPTERFWAVKKTEAFDYINWLPPRAVIDECIQASKDTGLPMTTGNCALKLGYNFERIYGLLEDAERVNMRILNVMLHLYAADGHEITTDEVVDAYGLASEAAQKHGLEVSFEVHVDCWSEKYKKVTPFIAAVREKGMKANLTLDYSHVIFKIVNSEEQRISGVEDDVLAGRIVLDPYEAGSLLTEWLKLNAIEFAQFRPVSPHNPRNIWARNPSGGMPRGIMYPFKKPGPGEWHSRWNAFELETCKEAFRQVMRYHLENAASPLKYVITEMITSADYGLNARFSVLEHNAECARWIRREWAHLKKLHAAGRALSA